MTNDDYSNADAKPLANYEQNRNKNDNNSFCVFFCFIQTNLSNQFKLLEFEKI